MSGSKRRSDNTAPALFPFLAVLLCTIGALVLILVITVTHSHASARREIENSLSEVQESNELIQSVSEDLEAQREILKSKVEKRRRDLADIEDHIVRLAKNLEQLGERIQHIQAEASETEASKDEKNRRVAELRKEVDAKKRELVEEIEKQKKRKPAFSIIPYKGTRGTSRRPVYLECTREGVIVQPEGLLISTNELRPPLGPGNPLDAALRVLRVAYQEKDATFGVTQPPYPLLLVRPDGIHTYALAREAMNGWDDQFGYELIDKEMDLKFPASVPGLKEQLSFTVDIAKRRQQAIVASMPRPVRGDEGDESWDSIDAANAPRGSQSDSAQGDRRGASGTSFGDSSIGSGVNSEWKLVQGVANSQLVNAIEKNGISEESAQGGAATPNGNALTPRGTPVSGNFPTQDIQGQFQVAQSGQAVGAQGTANGRPWNASNQPPGANGQPGANDTANSNNPNATNGTADGSPNGAGNVAANGGSGGTAQFGGTSGSNSSFKSDPRMNALSNGSATGEGSPNQPTSPTGADPSGTPNLSMSVTQESKDSKPAPKAKHVKAEGDLKPISVTAGQGWAASRAEGKATPVSRPINVIALKDRWLLRSDVDPMAFDETITMDDGPQQAGNKLATALKKRVDSWGLAVPGGFWSPSLTIESASDAQQSVARLERLLEGSGVELKVVPLKLPNRR